MEQVVIVQRILTEWTKASRGGEGAVRRNRVPEAVKLYPPQVQSSNAQMLFHQLYFSERDDFVQPKETLVQDPSARPLKIGCVNVDFAEGFVQAVFQFNSRDGGAPNRYAPRRTLTPTVNEWGRIAYNGRFADYDSGRWYYQKMVVNVGIFDPPSNSVFTRSAPNVRYEAMAHLF